MQIIWFRNWKRGGYFKITPVYYLQDFYGSNRISHEPPQKPPQNELKRRTFWQGKTDCILSLHFMVITVLG